MLVYSLIIALLFPQEWARSASDKECNPGLCAQFGSTYPGCPCQSDPTKPGITYVPAVQQGGNWSQNYPGMNPNGKPGDDKNLPSPSREGNGGGSSQDAANAQAGNNSQKQGPRNTGGSNGMNPAIPALLLAPFLLNSLGGSNGTTSSKPDAGTNNPPTTTTNPPSNPPPEPLARQTPPANPSPESASADNPTPPSDPNQPVGDAKECRIPAPAGSVIKEPPPEWYEMFKKTYDQSAWQKAADRGKWARAGKEYTSCDAFTLLMGIGRWESQLNVKGGALE